MSCVTSVTMSDVDVTMSDPDVTSVSNTGIYEGRDPLVKMVNICEGCKNDQNSLSPLLHLCARCRVVRYCSKECQKNDFKKHKLCCREIHIITSAMNEEADELRSNPRWGNVFKDHIGRFGGINETRDYMRMRLNLANEIYDQIASKASPPQSYYWELVIGHYQEMLRLCEGDNQSLRTRFPYLLLEANRDDDASCFVSYWLKFQLWAEEDKQKDHEKSSEGDWIYPRENGARFVNILEPLGTENTQYLDLAMLVAAACIKMRLVAIEMSHTKAIEVYNSTILGSRGNPVNITVESMLPGSDIRLKGQREQLDRLLEIIHQNNPATLPALLNPGPLLGQGRPTFYCRGGPSEAYFVVENAIRIWTRIPGATEILEAFFDRNPTSNASASAVRPQWGKENKAEQRYPTIGSKISPKYHEKYLQKYQFRTLTKPDICHLRYLIPKSQ